MRTIFPKPFVITPGAIAAGLLFVAIAGVAAPKGIQPWPENPWYWSYHGKPVLLLGGTDDDNLFQWGEQDLISHLDRLVAAGGNVIRNTMSDRIDKGFEVYPFKQLPGGQYDLENWNDEYWNRFERLLRQTARRDIIVQIEIWDRFDYSRKQWPPHPYNPKNNVNYTFEESGFAPEYPAHPARNEQPFFFTTPLQRNNRIVLRHQQRFVDKLLDHSLKYDHVLYCMDNETKGEPAWGRYWAEHVKSRAARAGRIVHVTEMWDDWDLRAPRHKHTFDHPDLYDFVDVSQNNQNSGDKHWDNFLYVRTYLLARPRPINTTKIYGATGSKFGHSDQDGLERFWRHMLGGGASMRFHRPDAGLGLNDKAVACIQAARKLEAAVPLWSVTPVNELLLDRETNAVYMAARPGEAYALYFPKGGVVRLDLSNAAKTFELRWISVESGEWGDSALINGGAVISIKSPGRGNWAAVITRKQ